MVKLVNFWINGYKMTGITEVNFYCKKAHHATITSSPTSNDDESGEKRRSGSSKSSSKSAWPEPDPSRMIAFKPSRRAEFGFMQPIPGGGMFLFPSIFADLIKRLPPPHCFQVTIPKRNIKIFKCYNHFLN